MTTEAAPTDAVPAPPCEARAGACLVAGWSVAALPLLVLRGLGVQYSFRPGTYLPLHVLLELAVALTGFATFAVQWYAAGARGPSDARARFLGSAFLGVGLFHTAHMMVFPGMPGVLGAATVERTIYYLLLGRLWMTGALLAAAFIAPESRRLLLGRGLLLALSLALVALAVAVEGPMLKSPGVLYQPGTGLTGAKIGIELAVALLAVAGAALHWRRWRGSRDRTSLRIAAALGLMVLSALCLSIFENVRDLYHLLGHAYALAVAALMFDGLFVAALLEPYRRLDRTTRELAASNARLDALRAHVEGELASTITRLEESSAREQLARAELEAAIAAVPEGIVVYSPGGQILVTNAAAERLLRTTEELSGETLLERWSRLRVQTTEGKPFPIEESPVVKALGGVPVPGVPASIETLDGKRLWVSISAAPIRAPDGRLDGAVAAITDIGAIQTLQSQREDLLRAVSHDLRNPLQIVLLQAERLQRLLAGTTLEKERLSADRIAHASKQMGVMIRDLVEAARVESESLELALQRVELSRFLQRMLTQSAGALEVGRVELDLPPDLPCANADPARLERIFVNLIGNALKYSSEGTQVRVSAAARDREILVSVIDRGLGIDPEDLPRVFERFYRGKRTRKADGLGLGLYIVQMLVQAHGGGVWAESRPGEGATFSFTLPAAG
jgi:PAS domain S-box-containing protein